MKILMLGDYSNLHACLSKELRRRGHDVTVISDRGSYMQTEADIELRRRPGILGSLGYLYRVLAMLPSWSGYDVVQLINPQFLELKPGKLRMIYDILKKNNRSVFLTLCGDDHFFVKDCVDSDLFRFSEFRVGEESTPMVKCDPSRERGWLIQAHASYTKHLYETIDGAMSVLPEYDMSARMHMDHSKLVFTNLPIELDSLQYEPLTIEGPVRILIGVREKMEVQKGTGYLLEICKELENEMHGKCEVRTVKNLSLSEYMKELRDSHIVIDQLYSYSPATNALQTMAVGRVSASGGQPEYYDYCDESLHPVFCLSPLDDRTTIKERLRALIEDKEDMYRRSKDGRKLVERHNDVRNVAEIFESHWKKTINHNTTNNPDDER
ncbi:MAG: glycosyltransferase [Muribaculaceae bacterium]|nr:glycosyltransferase [Muribaculaceae bacterium]